MRQEKLDQIKTMIPLMKQMMDEDLAISIWDREGTVLYVDNAETFKVPFRVGFQIEDKTDKLFQAMNTGKVVHNSLPREKFGIAIEGNLVPVFEGREVVGCIACVFSIERMEQLRGALVDSKDSIHGIISATSSSMQYLKQIHQFIDELEMSVGGVHNVVNNIKKNTSRTKMLALNASIEATRAGSSGAGFKIVANEMGKLSEISAESVVDIDEKLKVMEKSLYNVVQAVNEISGVVSKNSVVVEKMMGDLGKLID